MSDFSWADEPWDLNLDENDFKEMLKNLSKVDKDELLRLIDDETADLEKRNKAIKTAEKIGKLALKYGGKIADIII